MKQNDANDTLYQIEASRDYDPGPRHPDSIHGPDPGA